MLFRRTVTLEFMYVQVPKTGMQASKLNGDYHQTKFERSRVGLLSLLVTVSERLKKKKKNPCNVKVWATGGHTGLTTGPAGNKRTSSALHIEPRDISQRESKSQPMSGAYAHAGFTAGRGGRRYGCSAGDREFESVCPLSGGPKPWPNSRVL